MAGLLAFCCSLISNLRGILVMSGLEIALAFGLQYYYGVLWLDLGLLNLSTTTLYQNVLLPILAVCIRTVPMEPRFARAYSAQVNIYSVVACPL